MKWFEIKLHDKLIMYFNQIMDDFNKIFITI